MPFGLGKSERRNGDDVVEEEGAAVQPDEGEENGGSEAAATGDVTVERGAYRPPTFRPSFLEREAPSEVSAAATPSRPAPEGDTFFVSVTTEGGSEVHRFDDAAEAQAFVEQRLQEGVPEEEVSAFSGRRLAVAVSHRPVVKLFSGTEE